MRSTIDTGDAVLHCELRGEGPLVLCAHGFPDCERSFRHQLEPLAAAGYQVAAVSMRGYAPSSVSGSGRYDAAALGRDLLLVAEQLRPGEPFRLVGHDWGAIAAYAAAALAPDRVAQLVTMAVPHLRVASRRWWRPSQLRRSWYMGLFQLRGVSDARLLADDLALVERLWRDWSPGYRCPPAEMARIKDAIRAQPQAVLGYYRALTSPRALRRAAPLLAAVTQVPSLYLHGQDDGCVGVEMVAGVERAYRAGVDVQVLEGAGHFIHIEAAERVNELLMAFFAAG